MRQLILLDIAPRITMTQASPRQIQIQYFALLREKSGCSGEALATAAPTLRQLYEELKAKYGFPLACERLRVAVNDEFCSWDDSLPDGARVVFIPPVSGG